MQDSSCGGIFSFYGDACEGECCQVCSESGSWLFEFYRPIIEPEKLEEWEEALRRLLELYGVPAPPRRRVYDGKEKIIAEPGNWQEQFEELYVWIALPLRDKAETVQGELIRLSGRVYQLICEDHVTEWSDIGARLMFHGFLRYLRMGTPLSMEKLREAGLVIQEIIQNEKILHPDKLCELSVRWIQKNPNPIPLGIIFYCF